MTGRLQASSCTRRVTPAAGGSRWHLVQEVEPRPVAGEVPHQEGDGPDGGGRHLGAQVHVNTDVRVVRPGSHMQRHE